MAENQVTIGHIGNQIATALAQGSNSAGVDFYFTRKDFTVQVIFAGTQTTASVQLQGSVDGVNWFNAGSASSATTTGAFQVTNVPTRWVRIAYTGTGGGTASIFLAAI